MTKYPWAKHKPQIAPESCTDSVWVLFDRESPVHRHYMNVWMADWQNCTAKSFEWSLGLEMHYINIDHLLNTEIKIKLSYGHAQRDSPLLFVPIPQKVKIVNK